MIVCASPCDEIVVSSSGVRMSSGQGQAELVSPKPRAETVDCVVVRVAVRPRFVFDGMGWEHGRILVAARSESTLSLSLRADDVNPVLR